MCFTTALTTGFTLVTFVKTAPSNVARRAAIRDTWASARTVLNNRFEVIFVVGLSPGEEAALDVESEEFGDILQFNEEDNMR